MNQEFKRAEIHSHPDEIIASLNSRTKIPNWNQLKKEREEKKKRLHDKLKAFHQATENSIKEGEFLE